MPEIASNLQDLAARWAGARAGERANFQLNVVELCVALLVARPGHRGSGYESELQTDAITVERRDSANFIDCWKADHFALEGEDDAPARKGSASNAALLRRAYGQVRNYVHHVPGAATPPYLLVLDVARTLVVWDRWAGTYGGFEAGRRIDLATLHTRVDDIAFRRDVWQHPAARATGWCFVARVGGRKIVRVITRLRADAWTELDRETLLGRLAGAVEPDPGRPMRGEIREA